MRGGNRLEQDFPNKSSYIKYVEQKAKAEEAIKKEVGSGGTDLKREDDQPLSQATEEDIENHEEKAAEVSKLDYLLNKIRQIEEGGKFA